MSEYLDSVREIERRIQKAEQQDGADAAETWSGRSAPRTRGKSTSS